ncbi:probable Histone-lysine N-methyltransferase ATXR5 [Cajanus cajan]|uniref:[histone H3]-lysine(27) N-methyltransferase n=1 Tax=Cajanus cajan TaxID=3821 RepID=A0A151R860_CAJCA|nr:probable Histone-lysine N-methyltransferase ATXR5 [Cajanus cajan]KYP38818.1 Histone-lysine N-methyltransferase ATXR5 [Cajanus cajan]
MAPAASSPSAQRHVGFSRRTQAPRRQDSSSPTPAPKKYRMLTEVMARAPYAVLERETYSDLMCEQCGSGELPDELLLCDKCDRGFHMKCVRPIVVRVPIGSWLCPKCQGGKRVRPFSQKRIIDFFGIRRSFADDANDKRSSRDAKKRRKRSRPLVLQKKKRRLLPYVPTEDPDQRMKQMGSLATALTALNIEFSDHLTYLPGMAPRSANQALLEDGGMQTLTKEDMETVEHCNAMSKRGEFPPFMVVYDSHEGYTVEADDTIKDMTLIAEYTGDVDYLRKRERDDCDSMMTLLIAAESCDSLVICADKRGNIARFISGINNHTQEGRKKQNCKCLRYNVDGECRVFLVATRDISKGERLYYDYNGHEYQYPTHHFV